jgi:FkbM family methyltransferase
LASLYFADQYNPKRLICVEPNSNNIPILKHNLSGLGEKVTVIHAAISEATGIVSFNTKAETWAGTIREGGDPVPSYSMSDLIGRYVGPDRISLLKIDIEGGERLLFRGNLEWLRIIDSIIIELHPGMTLEDFERAVSPYGFRVRPPGSDLGNLLPVAVSR